MAAITVIGIVDQDHVARIEVPLELFQDIFHGELAPHVLDRKADRNRYGAPLRIPDPHRQVMELGDQIVLAGAVEHVSHFLADILEGMPYRRKSEGIHTSWGHCLTSG